MSAGKQAKDDIALLALACGVSVQKAAQQARLSVRTLRRRLEAPAFRRRIHTIRAEITQRVAGTLTAVATEAMKALFDSGDESGVLTRQP